MSLINNVLLNLDRRLPSAGLAPRTSDSGHGFATPVRPVLNGTRRPFGETGFETVDADVSQQHAVDPSDRECHLGAGERQPRAKRSGDRPRAQAGAGKFASISNRTVLAIGMTALTVSIAAALAAWSLTPRGTDREQRHVATATDAVAQNPVMAVAPQKPSLKEDSTALAGRITPVNGPLAEATPSDVGSLLAPPLDLSLPPAPPTAQTTLAVGQPMATPKTRSLADSNIDSPPPPVRMYMPAVAARSNSWPVLVNPVESAASLAPATAASTVPATVAVVAAAPTSAIETHLEKLNRPVSTHERAEAQYQRGLQLHQQGSDDEAETAFKAALSDEPTYIAARQALGLRLAESGRSPQAINLLAEGARLSPQSLVLATVLARVQADQQDLPGAIETMSSVLARVSPDTSGAPGARALQATLFQRAGKNDEAADSYRKALAASPGATTAGAWWLGLGVALSADVGDSAERRDAVREAFEHARANATLSPELRQYADERLAALAASMSR